MVGGPTQPIVTHKGRVTRQKINAGKPNRRP